MTETTETEATGAARATVTVKQPQNNYTRCGMLLAIALLITIVTGLTPIDRLKLSDPRGTLLVSQSILKDGDVKLTEYTEELGPELKQHDFWHTLYRDDEGEILFAYPVGVSFVSLPAVWVANLLGYDMLESADEVALQGVLAPLSVGGVFLLIFALSRIWLPYWHSLAWAAAMTLGTSLSSTLGVALFSHNGLVLWLLAALLLTFHPKCKENRWCAVATGFCLFMGFISRGQGAFFIIALYAYLLLADWRRIPWVVLGSLPPLLLFCAWSWRVYGALVPGTYYYHGWGFSLNLETLKILYGHTFSPSRGLFIFSPFLLVLLLAAGLYWRKLLKEKPLLIPLLVIPAHFFVVSSWDFWWGGWSFGPRLIVDTMPAWTLAGLVVIKHWQEDVSRARKMALAGSFAVLAVVASWINVAQGLHNPATLTWNIYPDHFEQPEIFWDWRFPQFLASESSNKDQRNWYERAKIIPLKQGERADIERDGIILKGWHFVETFEGGTFVWGDKGVNHITILRELISAHDLARPHMLQLWLGSYGPQPFTVRINGDPVGEYINETGGTMLYEIPLPADAALGNNDLEVEITAPQPRSPAEEEDSTDTRYLGVRLHGVAVVAGPAGSEIENPNQAE